MCNVSAASSAVVQSTDRFGGEGRAAAEEKQKKERFKRGHYVAAGRILEEK